MGVPRGCQPKTSSARPRIGHQEFAFPTPCHEESAFLHAFRRRASEANLLQALASAGDDDDPAEADRALRERILASIRDKPWASRPVTVFVRQGQVDLRGFVYSEDERAAIRVAAEATPGVEAVQDHLQIMSYMPPS